MPVINCGCDKERICERLIGKIGQGQVSEIMMNMHEPRATIAYVLMPAVLPAKCPLKPDDRAEHDRKADLDHDIYSCCGEYHFSCKFKIDNWRYFITISRQIKTPIGQGQSGSYF